MTPPPRTTGRRAVGRRVVRTGVLLTGAALLAVGCAVRSAPPPAAATLTDPAASQPAAVASAAVGMVGDQRSPAGATAAGVRLVRLLGSSALLEGSARDALLSSLTPDGIVPAALADRYRLRPNAEQITGLLTAVRAGEPLVAVTVPVLAGTTTFDGDSATVRVWVNAVLGTSRLGTLTQSWSTETVTLRWAGGRWALVADTSTAGPVPTLPQPPTDLATALAATAGMRTVDDVAG